MSKSQSQYAAFTWTGAIAVAIFAFAAPKSAVRADLPAIGWTESFSDDPVVAGRCSVPADHDSSRFSYEPDHDRLVVHYDTYLPTAWYVRPLDESGARTLGRCDDFEFGVTFRVRGESFFADPFQFAQIGWGLINSQTTGTDRAGGAGPDYAFDCVAFDFYPNVSPFFGGPTLGPTVVHTDSGQGYFSHIKFAFGAETEIDTILGDEGISLDVVYRAVVRYDADSGIVTLTMTQGGNPVSINADGGGGAGGPDGNVYTTQTYLLTDDPFTVDTFALTAWQDTFNPFDASVIADVEITEITVGAPASVLGDLNRDGAVDGLDIGPFVAAILAATPDDCLVLRSDFNDDELVTLDDLDDFIATLLGP